MDSFGSASVHHRSCRRNILAGSHTEQTLRQMEHRRENEGGLYAPEHIERANFVISSRDLLPNEVQIDVAGKTKEQVLAMMDAYEEVKAGVWAAFADYHEALLSATGHKSIEHVIYCDTCMDDGGHGDGVSEQILSAYN